MLGNLYNPGKKMSTVVLKLNMWISVVIVLVVAEVSGCIFSQQYEDELQTGTVPAAYVPIYSQLDELLTEAEEYLDEQWDGHTGDTLIACELLGANSNKGPVLLTEQSWDSLMIWLNMLEWMGVDAVSLCISYPILKPDFPRSDEYLTFYKRLIAELRRRGLGINVESTTIFPDPEFATLSVDYSDLTIEKYKKEKRDMLEIILEELKPDRLTVENEPGTREANTGLDFSKETFVDVVNYFVTDLETDGIPIGAGIGTWEDFTILEELAKIDIDYLDIHVYPINFDYFTDKIVKASEIAKKHGKGLAMAEAWLYKIGDDEFSSKTPHEIYARDAYSFWEPLDSRFITVLAGFAHLLDFESISFFWSQYFFGYIEYEQEHSYSENQELLRSAILDNVMQSPPGLTTTGKTLKALLDRKDEDEPC
jgi:hypothetical protein